MDTAQVTDGQPLLEFYTDHAPNASIAGNDQPVKAIHGLPSTTIATTAGGSLPVTVGESCTVPTSTSTPIATTSPRANSVMTNQSETTYKNTNTAYQQHDRRNLSTPYDGSQSNSNVRAANAARRAELREQAEKAIAAANANIECLKQRISTINLEDSQDNASVLSAASTGNHESDSQGMTEGGYMEQPNRLLENQISMQWDGNPVLSQHRQHHSPPSGQRKSTDVDQSDIVQLTQSRERQRP